LYFGANRKDVKNLTTPTTKKNKKEAFSLFFASCRERISSNLKVTKKKTKKREREKNREADISSFANE